MEIDSVKNEIKKTCVRLLEDWALMLVDETSSEGALFNEKTKFYETEIDFHGSFNGMFTIITQDDFVCKLVDNIIGEQADDEVKADALCEMANVFAGNLLTAAFGCDLVFDLGSPRCIEREKIDISNFQNNSSCSLLGDDAPVTIAFKIQP